MLEDYIPWIVGAIMSIAFIIIVLALVGNYFKEKGGKDD